MKKLNFEPKSTVRPVYRSRLTKIYLWMVLLMSGLWAVIWLSEIFSGSQSLQKILSFYVPPVLFNLGLAAGVYQILRWKKWGFYLYAGSAILSALFTSGGFDQVITGFVVSLVGIAIMFGVLQIGGKEKKPWSRLLPFNPGGAVEKGSLSDLINIIDLAEEDGLKLKAVAGLQRFAASDSVPVLRRLAVDLPGSIPLLTAAMNTLEKVDKGQAAAGWVEWFKSYGTFKVAYAQNKFLEFPAEAIQPLSEMVDGQVVSISLLAAKLLEQIGTPEALASLGRSQGHLAEMQKLQAAAASETKSRIVSALEERRADLGGQRVSSAASGDAGFLNALREKFGSGNEFSAADSFDLVSDAFLAAYQKKAMENNVYLQSPRQSAALEILEGLLARGLLRNKRTQVRNEYGDEDWYYTISQG